MLKKILILGVALMMCLGVFALSACESFDLDAHKATAVTAIENHATAMKAENGYTEAGYTAIDNAVIAGTTAVNKAETKAAVSTARDTAIQAIMDVPKEDDEEMSEILQLFDLTDSKETWNGSFDGIDFNFPVTIFISFRRLKDDAMYPELELRHINHANIKSFEYLFLTKPDTWSGDPSIPEEMFRQCGGIDLFDSSRDAVEEMIRHLEGLEFIKRVSPEGATFPT